MMGFVYTTEPTTQKGSADNSINLVPRGRDRPRSFWLDRDNATSGPVQLRKSAIHGLPVTLRMLRVKSDKSDWFWSRSIVFTKPFKTRMSLDLAQSRSQITCLGLWKLIIQEIQEPSRAPCLGADQKARGLWE